MQHHLITFVLTCDQKQKIINDISRKGGSGFDQVEQLLRAVPSGKNVACVIFTTDKNHTHIILYADTDKPILSLHYGHYFAQIINYMHNIHLCN